MKQPQTLAGETARLFEGIVNRIVIMRIAPRDYGTGERLYLGEIHAINAVGDHPGINITGLANVLGVTKGTVSPLVNRLEQKRYLRKSRDAQDGKTVLVRLTRKGNAARKGFENHRKALYAGFSREVTFGQLAIFNEILARFNAYLDEQTSGDG